jgi:S-adenosylmethionine:tRNA ribosyltransferase-isomerase
VHNIAEHRMHSERFDIPEATVDAIARTRARGGRVIAVGTTSLRALEAAAQERRTARRARPKPTSSSRRATVPVVDRLITNFHLPKSTLLMLVSAFAGCDTIRAAYRHAVAERYRFFSYGDAMLLERQTPCNLNSSPPTAPPAAAA